MEDLKIKIDELESSITHDDELLSKLRQYLKHKSELLHDIIKCRKAERIRIKEEEEKAKLEAEEVKEEEVKEEAKLEAEEVKEEEVKEEVKLD